MRLIDADALRRNIYHEAFETDTNEQRWDSGCWIRYKMFERNIDNAPTIDAVEVVRCRDCMVLQICRFAQGLGLDGFCSQGERTEKGL